MGADVKIRISNVIAWVTFTTPLTFFILAALSSAQETAHVFLITGMPGGVILMAINYILTGKIRILPWKYID